MSVKNRRTSTAISRGTTIRLTVDHNLIQFELTLASLSCLSDSLTSVASRTKTVYLSLPRPPRAAWPLPTAATLLRELPPIRRLLVTLGRSSSPCLHGAQKQTTTACQWYSNIDLYYDTMGLTSAATSGRSHNYRRYDNVFLPVLRRHQAFSLHGI